MIPDEWKDKNGYLKARLENTNEDNGILFSAYYHYLNNDPNELNAIIPLILSFRNVPNFLSHDNITGYLALQAKWGEVKMAHNWWGKYLHPRDLAFYYTLRGAKGLKWIIKLATKYTMATKYKYRHNIQYTVAESDRSFIQQAKVRLTPILPFLFKDKRKFEDSSGPILAWLRCQACGLGDWWDKQNIDIKYYFNMYFPVKEHPIIEKLNDRDI